MEGLVNGPTGHRPGSLVSNSRHRETQRDTETQAIYKETQNIYKHTQKDYDTKRSKISAVQRDAKLARGPLHQNPSMALFLDHQDISLLQYPQCMLCPRSWLDRCDQPEDISHRSTWGIVFPGLKQVHTITFNNVIKHIRLHAYDVCTTKQININGRRQSFMHMWP